MSERRPGEDGPFDDATEPAPFVAPEKVNGRRSRGNFGLRVPDDEIARPEPKLSSPPARTPSQVDPAETDGVMTPRVAELSETSISSADSSGSVEININASRPDVSDADKTLPMQALPLALDSDMLPADIASEPNLSVPLESDGFPKTTTQKRPRLGGPAALAAMLSQTKGDPTTGRTSTPRGGIAVAAHSNRASMPTPAASFTPSLAPARDKIPARPPSGEFDIPVDEDLDDDAAPPTRPSAPMPAAPVAAPTSIVPPRASSPPAGERRPIPPIPVGMASSPNLQAVSTELHSATVPALGKTPQRESPIAPPMASEATLAKKKGRGWWEEFFNEDYLRATPRLTEEQLVKEAAFVEDSLGVEQGARVLDLACGTGRHAIELSRRGYDVVGFDLSLAMLARAGEEAQAKSRKMRFVQGDMRDMAFEEHFDGVYCWNTSFGLFEEEKNGLVIGKIHRALKSGGLLLLDVANRDFLARQAPSLVWFEGEGCVCIDEMQMDWISSRVRVKRTMRIEDGRSPEQEYSIRVYNLHELGKLLHDNGFKVLEVSGSVSTQGVFFGADSPRIIILAEKK